MNTFDLSYILNIEDNKELIDLDEIHLKPLYHFKSSKMKNYAVFSKKIKSILDHLKKMKASSSIPLLIVGDTGVGKEMIAEFMHYEVDQSDGPYVAINCSNINKELFESELFGYVKGAFTGAHPKGWEGYIKQSQNGTLFLDEISEINADIQSKLLRVLETGEYFKIGGQTKQTVQSRLIFATNKKMEKMVEQGEFREDLYYRLNIVKADIPPLVKRKEEIIPLVIFFIQELNQKFNKSVQYIEPLVLKLLYSYNWPGNIRELKNFITQLMIFADGESIKYEHLQKKDELDRYYTQMQKLPDQQSNQEDIIQTLLEKPFDLESFTMKIVKKALEKFDGNKSKTAKFLGLKREQLYNRYKLKNDS